MDTKSFIIYLAIMAGSTYLVRSIPFVAINKKIENPFIQSFLYYIPYAVLTAMTIPGALFATEYFLSALIGLMVAVIFALKEKSLTTVAVMACISVYLAEFLLGHINL